jgi:FkbM family methyltransferase
VPPFLHILASVPPVINCYVPGTRRLRGDTLLNIVRQLLQHNEGKPDRAVKEIERFFADFDTPNNSYSHTTFDVVRRALLLGVKCGRQLEEIPEALARRLQIYETQTIHEVRKLMANVRPSIGAYPAPFEDDHGLKSAPQSLGDYIKGKAILDIGAWQGDSAIALAKYVRRVYSFELGPGPYRTLLRVLRQMGDYTQNVVTLWMGVGENESVVYISPRGGYAASAQKENGLPVNITTIDDFVRRTNETIGLIKVDTEGGGLGMLHAARMTLRTPKPILAMALYHEYDELLGIPRFIAREFPDYRFNWQMFRYHPSSLSELTYLAYPGHLDSEN